MNKAFCDSCNKLVPATPVERDGRIFLKKECPDCGTSHVYISSDAARYHAKRAVDIDFEYSGCLANCTECKHDRHPRFTFVNVTNRCNVNCPICFDNVPGLGFEFEPPMEYFDALFKQLSEYDPLPTICFFGGEPTVREDLFDLIKLAKSYGLRPWVFTNGIKLANEEYCRKIGKSRARIMFSYDGSDPETYRTLRGSAKILELKQKAIDNLRKLEKRRGGKITMVSVLAKGLNDQVIPELLEFCHERSDLISTVYLMPLVHAWNTTDWDYDPDRITTEDVEILVEQAFPGEKLDFLPLGFVNQFTTVMEYMGRDPLPYGAHPNCESVYGLVSDGEKYVPTGYFFKRSLLDMADALLKLQGRLSAREKRWEKGFVGRVFGRLRLRKRLLRLLGMASITSLLARRTRFARLLKGKGPAKLWHFVALPMALLFLRKPRQALQRHTNLQSQLKIIILPLEDNHVLETDRLERCPTLQAYLDPETQQARLIPLCAWKLHNKTILRKIADYYATRAAPATSEGTAAGA